MKTLFKTRVYLSTAYYPTLENLTFDYLEGQPRCPERQEGLICGKTATFSVRCRDVGFDVAFCGSHYERVYVLERRAFSRRKPRLPKTEFSPAAKAQAEA